jgi:thioredoxin
MTLICKNFANDRANDHWSNCTRDYEKRGVVMQVIDCKKCGAKNRVDESKLATSEAKCGRCGEKLEAAAGSGTSASDTRPAVITDQTFDREVMQERGRPVLVDAWAPWCGPCRMIAPVIDQLAMESQGRFKISKLNVDENPYTASRYQIASIPTMLIFKDGQLVDRLIGLQSKPAIVERLRLASRSAA